MIIVVNIECITHYLHQGFSVEQCQFLVMYYIHVHVVLCCALLILSFRVDNPRGNIHPRLSTPLAPMRYHQLVEKVKNVVVVVVIVGFNVFAFSLFDDFKSG